MSTSYKISYCIIKREEVGYFWEYMSFGNENRRLHGPWYWEAGKESDRNVVGFSGCSLDMARLLEMSQTEPEN
jgi:hypothetical protein